jgi:membrane-associated phospholipid phosphatase
VCGYSVPISGVNFLIRPPVIWWNGFSTHYLTAQTAANAGLGEAESMLCQYTDYLHFTCVILCRETACYGGKVRDFYFVQISSGHRVFRPKLFHSFFSNVPDKCYDNTFTTPRPLPFESFPLHHSPVILALALYRLLYWQRRWITHKTNF